MKNICKYCGKEINPTKYTPKSFCGTKHASLWFKENKGKTIIKTCQHCGKEYYYTIGQDNYKMGERSESAEKYCCYECGKNAHMKKIKQTKLERYGNENYQNIEYNKKLTQEQKNIRKIKCRQRMLNPNGVFQSKEYKEKMSKSLKKSIKKRGGIYNKGKNKENNIGMKKMSETKKKMHWYTNNIVEVFCKQCPDGFHLGRKKYSQKAIENIRAAAKNKKRREKISKAKKLRNNFNNSANVD